jgi:hypothetical protein
MKTLRVTVTEKNIEEGERMTCCSCPIARAINSESLITYPKRSAASVHLKDGWFTHQPVAGHRGQRYGFELPENAQRFVADFQDGKPVAPIEFELKLRDLGPRHQPSGTT